jgi:uncharacterized membrane protein YhdT
VKLFFRIILFFIASALLAPVFEILKATGLPKWAELPCVYLLLLTIAQVLLIIKSAKHINFLPTIPESCPGLKKDLLDNYTKQLTQLGFNHFSDYKVSDITPPIFFRIFFNTNQNFLAVIFQPLSGEMRFAIRSFFKDDWSLCDIDYRTDTFKYCSSQIWLRHQRHLWVSRPDVKVERILTSHLELRRNLIRDLDLKIIENPTVDNYFDHERMSMKFYNRNLKRKWIVVGVIQGVWLFFNPKTEWMGEYQARLDILKNSAF